MPDVQERLDIYASKMKLPISVFEPGKIIIRQGQRATEVYLIRKGEVEVYFEEVDENGDVVKETRVAVRGEGDFVGEMGILVNEKGEMLLHRAATFREGISTRKLNVRLPKPCSCRTPCSSQEPAEALRVPCRAPPLMMTSPALFSPSRTRRSRRSSRARCRMSKGRRPCPTTSRCAAGAAASCAAASAAAAASRGNVAPSSFTRPRTVALF